MRILEISVENGISTDAKLKTELSDELANMIEETRDALNPARLAYDVSNNVTSSGSLSQKLKALESDFKTYKWSSKVMASFIVDDFKGGLP